MNAHIVSISVPHPEREQGHAYEVHGNRFGGITTARLSGDWSDVTVTVEVRMSDEAAGRLRTNLPDASEALVRLLNGDDAFDERPTR